jgi:ABC-2 type transport system permease protein
MILNLILKDILGYWRYIIFSIFFPATLWLSILTIPSFPPLGNFIFCTAAIVAAISYFTFSEKRQKLETLVCSLPVSRKSVVAARYLFALCVAVFGIILLYFVVYASYLIYSKPVFEFHTFYNLKSLFISLVIISVSVSCFFPFTFKLRILGMIFTIPIGFTLGMHTTTSIFRYDERAYMPYFIKSDLLTIIIVTIVVTVMIILSVTISIKLFEQRDL